MRDKFSMTSTGQDGEMSPAVKTPRYDYFVYTPGGDNPDIGIRILLDDRGRKLGAETVNPNTGDIQLGQTRIKTVEEGIGVRESSAEEFHRLHQDILHKLGQFPANKNEIM